MMTTSTKDAPKPGKKSSAGCGDIQIESGVDVNIVGLQDLTPYVVKK